MSDEKVIDIAAMYAPVYEAVGEGITQYATMESMLAQIFALLMRPAPDVLSLLALDAVYLTAPKVRVVQSVANVRMPEDLKGEFAIIVKRILARTDMRIKLAHWTVNVWHPEQMPINSFEDGKMSARLIPPWNSTGFIRQDPNLSYSVDHIHEFRQKCGEVCNQMISFIMKLQDRVGGFEKVE